MAETVNLHATNGTLPAKVSDFVKYRHKPATRTFYSEVEAAILAVYELPEFHKLFMDTKQDKDAIEGSARANEYAMAHMLKAYGIQKSIPSLMDAKLERLRKGIRVVEKKYAPMSRKARRERQASQIAAQ